MKTRHTLLLVLALFSVGTEALAQSQELKRPPRIDDRLYDERFPGQPPGYVDGAGFVWSTTASGERAFAVKRAKITRKNTARVGNDIYVELGLDRPAINITNGAGDSSDWELPLWSPDKSKIVMSGSRGGYSTLWIWDRATQQLQKLSTRALGGRYYEWLDNRRILCSFLPEKVLPEDADVFWSFVPRGMNSLLDGWKQRFEDKEPSASVLSSGNPAAVPPSKTRQLAVIDIVTKVLTPVSEVYRQVERAGAGTIQWDLSWVYPSPGNEYVAFYRFFERAPGESSSDPPAGGVLELRRLDGQPLKLDRPLPQPSTYGYPRWSLDGKEVLYFVWEKREKLPKLIRVNLATGRVEMPDTGKLDMRPGPSPAQTITYVRGEWTDQGDIVVLVIRPERINHPERYALGSANYYQAQSIEEADWWLIPRGGGEPRVITAGMKRVPNLGRYSRNGPLVGVAEGELLRLESDMTLRNLTESLVPKLSEGYPGGIKWPRSIAGFTNRARIRQEEQPVKDMAIVAESKEVPAAAGKSAERHYTYYRIDTRSGEIVKLQSPNPNARLALMNAEVNIAFYAMVTNGERVETWRAAVPGGQPKLIHTLNTWRSVVAAPETGDFVAANGFHGQPQKHLLYRPIAYEKGKRYPVIVVVYPGLDFSKGGVPTQPFEYEQRTMGYAALRASSTSAGTGFSRRYHVVAGDVLPAVDKVVEMGIADPDRIVIQGQSAGGWMTLSIVTQTNRFKAAIATNGPTQLVSRNLIFLGPSRYGDDPMDMGGPMTEGFPDSSGRYWLPWENWMLYETNSPLTYVDRLQTPVMLRTGDQDRAVDMTQLEQFFSAMYRMGKRAEFVRYWGEGHGVDAYTASHQNGLDWFKREMCWFDEFIDIVRDTMGNPVWDGERMKSRGGKPPLKLADYEKFDIFQKGGPDLPVTHKSS